MTNTAAPERATYSVPEAAEILGVSPRHLYDLIARGDFPVIRLGARRLIPRIAIDQIINAACGSTGTE